MSGPVTFIRARIGGPSGVEKRFKGRFAWTLSELVLAGGRGVTPIERPAPRWSHYVWMLRRQGVPIETVEEQHGGPYAGRHARYVLSAPVGILECEVAAS